LCRLHIGQHPDEYSLFCHLLVARANL
jgi:hypothetical protein